MSENVPVIPLNSSTKEIKTKSHTKINSIENWLSSCTITIVRLLTFAEVDKVLMDDKL